MEYIGLDKQKRYRIVEPAIASGGEGAIYTIAGEPDKLAKVYLHPERVEQDKLRFMVMETQGIHGSLINRMIAWPQDALTDASGRIYGFVMSRFPGVTKLAEILPDTAIDWGKRVIIAWNLCEIVQDVEKINQCIGDMNPSNFGVDLQSGHVYAFDADSFHFRAPNGRLYPCYVGIAEYYAPELQRQLTRGQDMHTLDPERTFDRQTDRFALAVLLFQLLFAGYHPFSARRLAQYGSSTVVHRQATNILNKVCAYFNPQEGTGIPIDAPPLSIIPPELQQMFRRAFLTEDRPSAAEWQSALSDLSRSLKKCDQQHYYYSRLPACPWCAREAAHQTQAQTVKSQSTQQAQSQTVKSQTTQQAQSQTVKTQPTQTAAQAATPSQPSQGGAKWVPLLIAAVWVFLAYQMGQEAEAGSLLARVQSGDTTLLLFLAVPILSALAVITKGAPTALKALGSLVLGFVALYNWVAGIYWLDQSVLHLNLFFGQSTLGTILTVIMVFIGVAVGFAGGKACASASD